MLAVLAPVGLSIAGYGLKKFSEKKIEGKFEARYTQLLFKLKEEHLEELRRQYKEDVLPCQEDIKIEIEIRALLNSYEDNPEITFYSLEDLQRIFDLGLEHCTADELAALSKVVSAITSAFRINRLTNIDAFEAIQSAEMTCVRILIDEAMSDFDIQVEASEHEW